MAEQDTGEIKKPTFSDYNATAFENWIFGNSYKVRLKNGEEVLVSQDNIRDLFEREPHSLLSPLNILFSKQDVEQVNRARAQQGAISGMFMTLFGIQKFLDLSKDGIEPFLKLTPINEDGEVTELQVVFKKEGEELLLGDKDISKFEVDDSFKAFLNLPTIVDNYLVYTYRNGETE